MLQVLQATTAHKSAAVRFHRTAHQHKRPRCRPGCPNVPRAPNLPDEATPSHPQPTMGGLHRRLCPISRRRERTIGLLVCIYLPPSNPSPLKGPLQLTRGGGFNDSFHDNGVILPLRECPRLVNDMALGSPIHWIIFFVVGVIGLGPLINLLDSFTIGFLSLGMLYGF